MNWFIYHIVGFIQDMSFLVILVYVLFIIRNKIPFYIRIRNDLSVENQKKELRLDLTFVFVIHILSLAFVKMQSLIYRSHQSFIGSYIYIVLLLIIIFVRIKKYLFNEYGKDV